jgi:hypothetical protein
MLRVVPVKESMLVYVEVEGIHNSTLLLIIPQKRQTQSRTQSSQGTSHSQERKKRKTSISIKKEKAFHFFSAVKRSEGENLVAGETTRTKKVAVWHSLCYLTQVEQAKSPG